MISIKRTEDDWIVYLRIWAVISPVRSSSTELKKRGGGGGGPLFFLFFFLKFLPVLIWGGGGPKTRGFWGLGKKKKKKPFLNLRGGLRFAASACIKHGF